MITTADVRDLFGEFNHNITLKEGWPFAIAYGLNGVGKTKFLELINAAINVDLDRLVGIAFSELTLASDNGETLVVSKWSGSDPDETKVDIAYSLIDYEGGLLVEWNPPVEGDIALRRWLLRSTPYVPLEGSHLWHDPSDGEVIEYAELRDRFAHRARVRDTKLAPLPDELKRFFSANHTYLIETQRLAVLPTRSHRLHDESQSSPKWNVEGYAGDLRRRIERSLAENSLYSQRLDRSYPRRIIEQSVAEAMNEGMIRDLYEEQDKHRKRLVSIGLTSAEMDVPLPEKELESWQRAVLTTYLEDNASKLGTFDDLLARISLLEELINARFLRKEIVVNASEGLRLHSTTTGASIPVSGLSTGEQHELVLLYNLLFRIEKNTLVLIDEPEISLHVTWQKSFLDDVLRVAKLSEFRFIVATHSPQIIGKWWSRTVELGPGEK